MILPWASWIGGRLSLFLVCVLLVLTLVTAGITSQSFGRAADSARQLSSTELESLGHTMLLKTSTLEATIIHTALEDAARVSYGVAAVLASQMQEEHLAVGPPRLAQVSSGHWYDPDPDRVTALHVPARAVASSLTARDIPASAILNDMLPVLFPQIGDASGIYFTNPEGLTRSYPRRNYHESWTPSFDSTARTAHRTGTPEANPLRQTLWTPPYLDDDGSGLQVSAVTPIYAAGAFRGTLEVDISLTRLASQLDRIAPLPASFAFLIDKDGYLVTGSAGAAELFGYVENPGLGTRSGGPRFDSAQQRPCSSAPAPTTPKASSTPSQHRDPSSRSVPTP